MKTFRDLVLSDPARAPSGKPRLNATDAHVALELAMAACRDGIAYPGNAALAKVTGLTTKSVENTLKELRACGLLRSLRLREGVVAPNGTLIAAGRKADAGEGTLVHCLWPIASARGRKWFASVKSNIREPERGWLMAHFAVREAEDLGRDGARPEFRHSFASLRGAIAEGAFGPSTQVTHRGAVGGWVDLIDHPAFAEGFQFGIRTVPEPLPLAARLAARLAAHRR